MKLREPRDWRLVFPCTYRPYGKTIAGEPVFSKEISAAAIEHTRRVPFPAIPDTIVTYILGA